MAEATGSAGSPRIAKEWRWGGRQRYGTLLVVIFVSIAVQGIVEPTKAQQAVVTVLSAASLWLAFQAARLARPYLALAAAVAVIIVVLNVLRAFGADIGDGAARLMNAGLVALGPPAIVVGVMRDLRAHGRVRLESMMGVLALYPLLGMVFAFVYGAVDDLGDGAFFADGVAATVSNCLYFSFTTLTTVGFGDYVARTDLGHTLAVLEALIGQIFLVTVVSLFVSNLGRPTRRADTSAEA